MEGSHTAVEIKIKTLDSQVYTCRVEKNVSVPDLKEQVALVTGVPSESQRLICRGKVLKDEHALSAYEVEDGHTLHLVTRPAAAPSVSIASEEQEFHDYSPYNRSGHVSHSVLVGAFNFPDRSNGVLPELNRMLSSVLSSLHVGSYFLPSLGAGNGILTSLHSNAIPLSVGAQESEGHADQISERRVADQAIPAIHQGAFDPIVGMSDSSQETFHVSGMPGVSHVQILHQAVPNAIRTLSQHVDQMEQIYTARSEQAQLLSPNVHGSAQTQSSGRPHLLTGEDWNPMAWGSLFRRVQELLGNQAVPDLQSLANQLEAQPSLESVMARGDLLFTGMILEQMGRLLFNLSGMVMAISREPSQSGGVSAPTAESDPRQSGETLQHVDNVDVTGNMDIHIHAGFPSFLVARSLLAHAAHDGPSLSLTIDGTRNSTDNHANQASHTNSNNSIHPSSLESLQAASNLPGPWPGNAEAPELSQGPFFLDGSSGSRGAFYPLLARFQQLNPSLLARHDAPGLFRSEDGSSVQRDLGSGNSQYLNSSVLQPVVRNEGGQAFFSDVAASEHPAPARSLHLEGCDRQTEPGFDHRSSVESGHDTTSPDSSVDCQDLIRPLNHVLDVLPMLPREQEQPGIHQGHAEEELMGKADAETALQLKCIGQSKLDIEELPVLSHDGLLISNTHSSAPALSVDDEKIFYTSGEIDAFSEGLQSDELVPFLCRTRVRQESEECCNLEDASTIASRGTILRDFLSTLACRKEERCHLQMLLTENAHDSSLVRETVENQGVNYSGSNHKQRLEIDLDSLGSSSGSENFGIDMERATVKGIRLGGLHDSNTTDDGKGLQQLFPLAHISDRHSLSPSLYVDELEKGKPVSLDSGSLLKFQEISASASRAGNEPGDLKRHIADHSLESLPAFKRQKML